MPLLQRESSREHAWARGLRNDQQRDTAAMVRTQGSGPAWVASPCHWYAKVAHD
jgi:hypothetical protein